jgi:hypothetical protein
MGIASRFASTLKEYPEISIFLAPAIGYYAGKSAFRAIGLGSVTGTLLARLLIGPISPSHRRLRRQSSSFDFRRNRESLPSPVLMLPALGRIRGHIGSGGGRARSSGTFIGGGTT